MKNKTINGTIFLDSGHVVRFNFCEKHKWIRCVINSDNYPNPITLECKNFDPHPHSSISESIREDMMGFIAYFDALPKSHGRSDFEKKEN